MQYSTWFRGTCLLLVAAAAVTAPTVAPANPIVPYTLRFEQEGLDLDTGTIVPTEPLTLPADPGQPQPDLVLACNSERSVHAVVLHNRLNGVEIAFLDGVAFNTVDATDLAGLSFTAEAIDEPFETTDSIVLRTDTGAHYLLGNSIEDADAVTFDTQLLDETRAGLVRPTWDALLLVRENVSRHDTPFLASTTLPSGLPATDWRRIRGLIDGERYRFQPVSGKSGAFTARNAEHGLRAELDGTGLNLSSSADDEWDWSLALTSYGYSCALRPAESGELVAEANRLEHRRGDLIEWYVNDGHGLEQGFTLAAPPSGERAGPLVVRLATSGSLSPAAAGDGTGVRLVDGAGRTVLRYAGLLAWDATGRKLPARLAAWADGLRIEIDDAEAVYPLTIDPTVVYEDAKLGASDAGIWDNFGSSVALAGDTVVVGAYLDDHSGVTNAGSAYVFVRDGTGWSEQAKLTASDAAYWDFFGRCVALSGDTAVIGSGAGLYVFVRSGTVWSQQANLTASDGFPIAAAAAISGDTVVTNGAYVFVRSGTAWSEQARLTVSDASPLYGYPVAVSGDTAVVGADAHPAAGFPFGSVYVFVRSGTTWTEQAQLTAGDPDASGFSRGVAISGDTVVVGAPFGNWVGDRPTGSAYVFVRSGTAWSQQAKLTASDAPTWDFDGWFGYSVALASDTAVIGAFHASSIFSDPLGGAGYVFVRSGTTWNEQAKLMRSDSTYGMFGYAVTSDAVTAVMGDQQSDHAGIYGAGSAYVFDFNQSPIALCADVTVSAGPECTSDASIDAGSSDPDGDPISLSQDPPGPYGLGDTPVTLTVTDENGASGSCSATVTVEDTTPPELTVTLSPDTLWPPNHRMVRVDATVVATDACSTPSVVLTSVISNEADNGAGDGNTINDVQEADPGTPDYAFKLRAERAGGGNGRIYTAIYMGTDAAGNAGSAAGFAVIPHDQGGMTDPLEILLEENGSGTLVWWNDAPGAQSYNVIRGHLSNLVETEVVISLGAVACVESDSADASTAGSEDSELPDPGQAFFYLVEYDDGTSSSYGTESAAKPRAPGPGACP